MVDDEIAKLNDLVLHEQAYTFDITLLKDLALNLTMTRSPVLKQVSNLIKFNFDGTFNQMKNSTNQN